MTRNSRWSKLKRSHFLKILKQTGNVSAAARGAGLTRARVYQKREADPNFRRDWEAALEEALDDLEGELRSRALVGTDKPVYYAGKEIGRVKTYNDNLAMFLLKSRRGQVFGEESKETPKDGLGQDGNAVSPREKLLTKLDGMNPDKKSDDGN